MVSPMIYKINLLPLVLLPEIFFITLCLHRRGVCGYFLAMGKYTNWCRLGGWIGGGVGFLLAGFGCFITKEWVILLLLPTMICAGIAGGVGGGLLGSTVVGGATSRWMRGTLSDANSTLCGQIFGLVAGLCVGTFLGLHTSGAINLLARVAVAHLHASGADDWADALGMLSAMWGAIVGGITGGIAGAFPRKKQPN